MKYFSQNKTVTSRAQISIPWNTFVGTTFFTLGFLYFLSFIYFFLRNHCSLQVHYLLNFLTDFMLLLKYVLAFFFSSLPKHIFTTKRLPSSGSIQSARSGGHTVCGWCSSLTVLQEMDRCQGSLPSKN